MQEGTEARRGAIVSLIYEDVCAHIHAHITHAKSCTLPMCTSIFPPSRSLEWTPDHSPITPVHLGPSGLLPTLPSHVGDGDTPMRHGGTRYITLRWHTEPERTLGVTDDFTSLSSLLV